MKEFFEPRKLTGSISLNLQKRGKWVADIEKLKSVLDK